MWSRLRLAVELDCDGRVLLRGVQKPAYGQLLVELSSNRPWTSPAIPAFSWGTSHLEQRLVAMTARPKRFRTVRRIASGAVAAAALLAAANAELPAPQELQAMESSLLPISAPAPAQRHASNTQAARSTGVETRELARVATALRAREIQLRASEQDTIPRKKVRKAPVAVLKKAPVRKSAADSANARRVLRKVAGTADSGSSHLSKVAPRFYADTVWYNPLVSPKGSAKLQVAPGTDSVSARKYYTTGWTMTDSVSGRTARLQRADTVYQVDSVVVGEVTGSRVRIRGYSSVPLNNKPLIIVDGFIFTGSLDDIDPASIEKVDVIKGQRATALYGALAPNGVIVIQTKR
ncbi:MAG: TonB-dependent receptor plug domain-containing protein, partial [Phycisphaerae bacterium]|nr:TonB-dependent receptor plug domain-containing protein [Gemmatimonadaceae bacterium]